MNGRSDDWLEDALESLDSKLNEVLRRIEEMAIDQATFDTDLAALVQAISDLDSAVEALIASKAAVDLTAEDTSVQTAAAAVTAELAKLAPTPPPPAGA
jgi:chromosome segregation ATPase